MSSSLLCQLHGNVIYHIGTRSIFFSRMSLHPMFLTFRLIVRCSESLGCRNTLCRKGDLQARHHLPEIKRETFLKNTSPFSIVALANST